MLMVKQHKKQVFTIGKTWVIVGLASLALNALFLIGLLSVGIIRSHGELDYAIANEGKSTLCSDSFRTRVSKDRLNLGLTTDQQKEQLAYLDYECGRNGADTFYEQGYKEYANSLGLKTD